MRRYLKIANPADAHTFTIRKTRFGDIMKGMSLGGAYAFDEEAYGRFYPLAKEAELPVPGADFRATTAGEIKFMTVKPI